VLWFLTDQLLFVEKVDEQLKSLERSQSFEETQRFYDAGKYEKVVECILKTNLNQVKKKVIHSCRQVLIT
jgi:hypothetical protein